jgi:hypothetical protein
LTTTWREEYWSLSYSRSKRMTMSTIWQQLGLKAGRLLSHAPNTWRGEIFMEDHVNTWNFQPHLEGFQTWEYIISLCTQVT